MGLDIHYQAMPANCSLIERARHDGEFGCYLEFFHSYATKHPSRLANYADDDVTFQFVIEAKRVIQNYSGLENRNYSATRHWDMLHYLLSEQRRQGDSQDEEDWAKRAIRGGNILNPQAQTSIGSPIRYLAPDETRELAEHLTAISLDELYRHWDVAAMIESAVYKIHPQNNEETFDWVRTLYHQLSDFYGLVSRHDEGVVTCLG